MKFGHAPPPRQQPPKQNPPAPPVRQHQEAPQELRKPPRPYSWKTDEFKLPPQGSARQTSQIERMASQPAPGDAQLTRPLVGNQGQAISQGYKCPRCLSPAVPHMTRKISSAGWIVFAVLLVFFFPLFWVGLLIKEDVVVCPVCNHRVN